MATTPSKDKEKRSAPIILVDGDKGGVGKSIVASALADWMHHRKMPIGIVDGDARNADVSRLFEDLAPIARADLRIHEGWMDLTDFVFGQPTEQTIIVSMPAGIGGELKREANRFIEMARQVSRSIALFWVINRTPDSVILLNQALSAIGQALSHKVVFKNLFFGEAEKFRRWDGSEIRRAFEAADGMVQSFPELHERVMDKLFAKGDLLMPYSEANVPVSDFASSQHGLTASECIELSTWLKEVDLVFRKACAPVGLQPA